MEALNTLSKRYGVCFPFCFIRDADLRENMLPNANAKYLSSELQLAIYLFHFRAFYCGLVGTGEDTRNAKVWSL